MIFQKIEAQRRMLSLQRVEYPRLTLDVGFKVNFGANWNPLLAGNSYERCDFIVPGAVRTHVTF